MVFWDLWRPQRPLLVDTLYIDWIAKIKGLFSTITVIRGLFSTITEIRGLFSIILASKNGVYPGEPLPMQLYYGSTGLLGESFHVKWSSGNNTY